MPTYKNISVSMHTPFSMEGLPEIAPSAEAAQSTSPIKRLIDVKRNLVSVFVPVEPQSLFWIAYEIDEIAQPKDGSFFVFKMLVNRQEIVTWCCDGEERWGGKTMFGLFDTGRDEMVVGGAGMEKRVFKFGEAGREDWRVVGDLTADGEMNRYVEVRVCRANMKMRVPRELEVCAGVAGTGLDLANAGATRRGNARCFYKFGLIDPQDAPYARFRFYYRTWEEIDELSLRMGQVDTEELDSVFTIRKPKLDQVTREETPGISTGPDRFSISAEHTDYRGSHSREDVLVNGDGGSQSHGHQNGRRNTLQSSPDRGRPRRTTHIPTAARSAIYRECEEMVVPVAYRTSNAPWVPPMPPSPRPNRPGVLQKQPSPLKQADSPPPLLNPSLYGAIGLNYYPLTPALPRRPLPAIPDAIVTTDKRRSSIPQPTITNPSTEHGPSPHPPLGAKDGSEEKQSSLSQPPKVTSGRRRAETGDMLMSVIASSLRRRATEGSRSG